MLDSQNTNGLDKQSVDRLIDPSSPQGNANDMELLESTYALLHQRYVEQNLESVILQVVPQLVSVRPINRWGVCSKLNCNGVLLPFGLLDVNSIQEVKDNLVHNLEEVKQSEEVKETDETAESFGGA